MIVNLEAFRSASARAEPYPHAIVPGFLPPDAQARVRADYPKVDVPGVFMPDAAAYGPAVAELLEDLESQELREAVSEKLGVDLAGRPPLISFRSRCQARDGRIHTDSKFKLATLLLYLNDGWQSQSGRLRVLCSPNDIEDYAAEVPPDGATLFCFKVQENSWHGHKPFVGPRRCVMVNYCVDEAVRDSEAARHRMSMRWKKLRRFFVRGAPHEQAA